MMNQRRPGLGLYRFSASIAAVTTTATALVFVASPTAARAQNGTSGKAADAATAPQAAANPTREHFITESLQKSVGKADAALFGNLLESLGDGRTALHMVAETTATVKQDSFNGTITGKTTLRGNYAGAFVSDHELTAQQKGVTVSTKTQFVSDGKTLWTIKPDEKQYTEQPFASAKEKLSDAIMEASFDVASLLGAEAANGFKNLKGDNKNEATFKVETGAFGGVPCRILTVTSNGKDKDATNGTLRVFVGPDKQLRALEMTLVEKKDGSLVKLSENIKTMDKLTPPPSSTDPLFTFTPSDGIVKVDKFDE